MIKISMDKSSELMWIGLLLTYSTEYCPPIVLNKLKKLNIDLEQDVYFEKSNIFEEDISINDCEKEIGV